MLIVPLALQDEALDLIGGASSGKTVEDALALLASHCNIAVVTLGDKGCIARRKGEADVFTEPACSEVQVVDSTGMKGRMAQWREASVCEINKCF